jgi:alpha-1,3-glucan synthase
MTATKAWQRHGCYRLGSEQFYNMALNRALLGCHDDWNSLDHFDPTTDTRRVFAHFFYLRTVYNALQDGFNLAQAGKWTTQIELPGSNGTQTEIGLWTATRGGIPNVQNLTGDYTGPIWLLYTNMNVTTTWDYPCTDKQWISTPFQSGVAIKNIFYPYETYNLTASQSPYYADGKAPFFGCMQQVIMEPMSFKAFVPIDNWVAPRPAMTRFLPGHDARILAEAGQANATTADIVIEFSTPMDCDSVTSAISFNMSSSGHGGNPTILASSIKCATMDPTNATPSNVVGADLSGWSWSATLQNFHDGILEIIVTNPSNQAKTQGTGVCFFFHLLLVSVLNFNIAGNRPSTAPQGSREECHGFSRFRLRQGRVHREWRFLRVQPQRIWSRHVPIHPRLWQDLDGLEELGGSDDDPQIFVHEQPDFLEWSAHHCPMWVVSCLHVGHTY